MKRIISIILLALILFGCAMPQAHNSKTENSVPHATVPLASPPKQLGDGSKENESTSSQTIDFDPSQYLGEYKCSNDYFAQEFFLRVPEAVPSITFKEDNLCELVINYFEGLCTVYGRYTFEEDKVLVEVDLEGTIFKEGGKNYIPTEYVFNIVDSYHIIVDKSFSGGVISGDVFIKKVS